MEKCHIGKIIRALIFTAFCSIFLSGSVFAGQVTFPEDLMCQGVPIHPACIVATQFGDSSRFEPVPVQPLLYDQEVSFDSNTNWVKSIEKYSVFIDYTSYRYLGTFDGKHLVFAEFYDTAGTGRFSTLGFVRRVGNTLVNAGEIDLFKND